MKNIFSRFTAHIAATIIAASLSLPAFAQDAAAARPPVIFAVVGDTGTGDNAQRAVAQQMVKQRQKTQFEFVIML
ncbi:MAG: hypothetical protein ACRD82_09715, partial [Blastocatellia bacterium]